MRGEHGHARLPTRHHAGIIPACAGNTVDGEEAHRIGEGSSPHTRGTPVARQRSASASGDHPRIRGEHEPDYPAGIGEAGIIPAYAGNTSHQLVRHRMASGSSPHTRGTREVARERYDVDVDHPRIRGEHFRED